MDKRSHAEVRADIEKEDRKKDVHIHLGVFIAFLSGVSAAGAGLAILSVTFLGEFRQHVSGYWMSCLPFVFPAITGVSLAYRKQLASVGIHLALLLGVCLAGGFGFYTSVEPIYIDRHNCTAISANVGDCDKEVLVLIYVCAGAVACGFGLLGFLVSLCACNSASKKRASRDAERALALERQDITANKPAKHVFQSNAPRPVVVHAPATNGSPPKSDDSNGTATADATTHL